MKALKILLLTISTLFLMACAFTVNVPRVNNTVTRTFEINEEAPAADDISLLSIEMGAGTLNLSSGTDRLVEGTVVYNIDSWEPAVIRQGNSVTLKQTTSASISIPGAEYRNEWNLKLGPAPIELNLTTGAYTGELELGGLTIKRLSISDGASKSTVRFDEPNNTTMSLLSYKTGASNIELRGLGNARVSNVDFEGGVGSYLLDFTGINEQDLQATIKCGMSDITVIIPENARAEINVQGEMSNTNLTGTWTVESNQYKTGTTGALITINVDMSVGNLNLIQEK